jgi:hypothetical protein
MRRGKTEGRARADGREGLRAWQGRVGLTARLWVAQDRAKVREGKARAGKGRPGQGRVGQRAGQD